MFIGKHEEFSPINGDSDVFCNDTQLFEQGDTVLTREQCFSRCTTHIGCNFVLYKNDTNADWVYDCVGWASCTSHHSYEDGAATVYERKKKGKT